MEKSSPKLKLDDVRAAFGELSNRRSFVGSMTQLQVSLG